MQLAAYSAAACGLENDLSWKIFLDRYTQKDLRRAFVVGDVAIVQTNDDPKWPKKEIARVEEVLGDRLRLTLLTGSEAGEAMEVAAVRCDRPLERAVHEVAARVGKAIAAVEPANTEPHAAVFTEEIAALRLVPGGRVWAGAGSGVPLTLFNCYVIPNPRDSRQGIIDTLGQMIEIMARGGGVGINVSTLRPYRAPVKGVNGRSSGAVSWMDLYSRATGLVEQGGSRRGALMLQLEVWHPDVWRFIDVKKRQGMVENANISLRISDAFMAAVKGNASWDLVFPDTEDPVYDTEWNGDLAAWREGGHPVVVYETVEARRLWKAITDSAWQCAEPGIVFSDRHEADSNSWYYNSLISTNPCVTGDTLVSTTRGLIPVADLCAHGTPPDVTVDRRLAASRTAPVTAAFSTGVREVYRLVTAEGFELRVTEEHRIRTDRGWVAARDLVPGADRIHVLNQAGGTGTEGGYDLGLELGALAAAGLLPGGAEVPDLALAGAPAGQSVMGSRTVGMVPPRHPEASVLPREVLCGTRAMQVGFLRALFSARATVAAPGVAGLAPEVSLSGEPALLRGVQHLLLNLGIFSRQGRTHTEGGGGTLRLSGPSLGRFALVVGFLGPEQTAHLQAAVDAARHLPPGEEFVATFQGLIPAGRETVYDLTVPDVEAFSANGLVVHNCAEQPLPAWGVCTLAHVNLSRMFADQGEDGPTGGVDWERLRRTVHAGVRFLDDVVDATPYFFAENRDNQRKERRVGLGTMGLAELLIRLGLRYGAPETEPFLDRLFGFIRDAAYACSIELAKEKGPFPAFDAERYLQSGFVRRLPEALREEIREHGIRNVTLLTQAPTGTVGTMVDTSTGIEPYFSFKFFRQSRLGFDEQWVPLAQQWLDQHPGQELPPHFVSAMQLTPEEHIRVQAVVQRYTDSSISKTANAPNGYTREQTEQLYLLAYETGCKGVTIYRDGSREEQVLHDASKEEAPGADAVAVPGASPSVPTARARPSLVRGQTVRMEAPEGTVFVTLNEHPDGTPFEIFVQAGKAGSDLAASVEAIARLASLALRSGIAPSAIADQLSGIGGRNSVGFGPRRVRSVADAIARAMQQVWLDARLPAPLPQAAAAEEASPAVASNGQGHANGRATRRGDLCPVCGEYALLYQEGCVTCSSCGHSEC